LRCEYPPSGTCYSFKQQHKRSSARSNIIKTLDVELQVIQPAGKPTACPQILFHRKSILEHLIIGEDIVSTPSSPSHLFPRFTYSAHPTWRGKCPRFRTHITTWGMMLGGTDFVNGVRRHSIWRKLRYISFDITLLVGMQNQPITLYC
jgi:hypothetical protein